MDLDDIVKSGDHDYIRILSFRQINAKLAQLDKYESGMVEVSSSNLTGGNILLLNFLFSHSEATDVNIANFV